MIVEYNLAIKYQPQEPFLYPWVGQRGCKNKHEIT